MKEWNKQIIDPACKYNHRIGASGTEEKVDVMCVLPLNVVNEKIFYVLWFWYILLALASLLNLAYRIITYFSEKARV